DRVLEVFESGRERGDFQARATPAILLEHEQNARSGAGERESELALAKDRHEGTADRSDAQGTECDRDEFRPVRELIRDSLARPHAEREEQCGDASGFAPQPLPGPHAGTPGALGGERDDRGLLRMLARALGDAVDEPLLQSTHSIEAPMSFIATRNSG